ncbi:hypothetical protein CHUAL_010370 [Chamberlinius hualienensis]
MASRVIYLHNLIGITLLLACLQGAAGIDITLNFIKEPEDIIVKRNQPVLLDCSSYSSPEYGSVNVTWYHKDSLVDGSDGRRQILNNGSLYIRKVRFKKHPGSSSSATTGIGVSSSANLNFEANVDDSGPYHCTISNNMGTLVSRQGHIYLATMAKKFTIEPEPAIVEEGDVVRFTCQIQAFPFPKYSWQKESNTSENSDPWIRIPQVEDSRFTVLAGGTLQISGVLFSDAGNYRCIAHGFEDHEQPSAKALLQVVPATHQNKPPTFLTKEVTVMVKSGEIATLECLVSGNPIPSIAWSRIDDKPIRTNGVMTSGMGNLVLSSVTLDDNGTYSCTATAPKGEESISFAQLVHLHVQKLPEFVKKPRSASGPLGGRFRLECDAQGVPKPTITWLKNGKTFDIQGRTNLRNNELVFSQTISADSGLYQCRAENYHGQRLVTARLQVKVITDQPGPPTSLNAITRSNTSIELFWKPSISSTKLPIQAYTIHFSQTEAGHENSAVSPNNSIVLGNLQPYTNYTFYVRAWTGRSPSELSDSITWMTGEDIPVAAPAVVLTSNLTCLHITWDELQPNTARGIITSYKIQWRKKNHSSYKILEVPGHKREYTITGLRPGNEYDVRVLAATKVGYPNLPDSKWPWVTHIMPDNVVPHVPLPPTLLLTVVNYSTIKVSWKMPEDSEFEAKGFELRYGKPNNKAIKSYTLPGNTSHFILTHLDPHSTYEVRISGFNDNGNGTESVSAIVTSSDTSLADEIHYNWYVIEPPRDLDAFATSSRSIRLTWESPLTNKNISSYTVRCTPVHNTTDFNTSVVRYFKSEKPEVNLTDLMPYTQYEFAVRSHNQDNKTGPYSDKVECKTLEDVPTAPQLLKLFLLDPQTIRVTWQPPKYPNGVIISYDVMYSTLEPRPHLDRFDQWSMVKEQGSESASLVNGLSSNTMYYLCVRAETRAGAGPPTDIKTLKIPKLFRTNGTVQTDVDDEYPEFHDSQISIIVGVSIGVCCMIICALIIIFRHRCFPSPPPLNHRGLHNSNWRNGYSHHHSNGNGHISREYRISSSESHEMECVTPMLTNIPETNNPHLDTKGGYLPVLPYANGHAVRSKDDGVPCSNGHAGGQTFLINITPNPQFEICNVNEDKEKQRNSDKTIQGLCSSSALLLENKSVANDSCSFEDNQVQTVSMTQSTGNLVTRDKQNSPNGILLPSQDQENLAEENHCQQQRPHSHHSINHRPHHNSHNQSSKHSKRNSVPSNTVSGRNNVSTNPTSISPSSLSGTASESTVANPSSSSTIVIIPTVTKNDHHGSSKDGGRRWRPLSHTAISVTPTKVTGLNNSNGSCNSTTSSGAPRPKSSESVRLSSSISSGNSDTAGSANTSQSETSQKMFSNALSSSPTSSNFSSSTSQSQLSSSTSHLLCATNNNTNSHKSVVQT